MNSGNLDNGVISAIKTAFLGKFQISAALGATLLLGAGFVAPQMNAASAAACLGQNTGLVVCNAVNTANAAERVTTFAGNTTVIIGPGPLGGFGIQVVDGGAGNNITILQLAPATGNFAGGSTISVLGNGGFTQYNGTANISFTGANARAIFVNNGGGGTVALGNVITLASTYSTVSANAAINVNGATHVNAQFNGATLIGGTGGITATSVAANGTVQFNILNTTITNNGAGNGFAVVANGNDARITYSGNIGTPAARWIGGLRAQGNNGQVVINQTGGTINALGNGIDGQSIGSGNIFITTDAGTKISTLNGTGINAIQHAAAIGNITITQNGVIDPPDIGINAVILNAANAGNIQIQSNAALAANVTGINATTVGTGFVAVGAAGPITAGTGRGINVSTTSGAGVVGFTGSITSGQEGIRVATTTGAAVIVGSGNVTSTLAGFDGVVATSPNGAVTVNLTGAVNGAGRGIRANSNNAAVSVTTGAGNILGNAGDGIVATSNAGSVAVTTGAGTVTGIGGSGINTNVGAGVNTTITTGSGNVTGTLFRGIQAIANGGTVIVTTGAGGLTRGQNRGINVLTQGGAATVTTNGNVLAITNSGIHVDTDGGAITINANGVVFAPNGDAIFADGRNAGAGANPVIINTGAGPVNGSINGIFAQSDTGAINVNTGAGAVEGGAGGGAGHGIRASTGGAVTIITGTGLVRGAGGNFDGINTNSGAAQTSITTAGTVTGNRDGIQAISTGTVNITTNGNINATTRVGILVRGFGGAGPITVVANGTITAGTRGIETQTTNGVTNITSNGTIVAGTDGIRAFEGGAGNIVINVSGKITAVNNGVAAATGGAGTVTINLNAGANIDPLIGASATTLNGAALINVANGATVDGDTFGAIASSTNGTATVNNVPGGGGNITSLAGGTAARAQSTNNNAQVRNGLTGLIISTGGIAADVASTNGALAAVNNAGVIATTNNTAVRVVNTNVDSTVVNSGRILAAAGGIGAQITAGRDSRLINSGLIDGGNGVVGVANRNWILNNTGTISRNGGAFAVNIFAQTADVTFNNNGLIAGNSFLTAGDDIRITNNGTMRSNTGLDTGQVLLSNSIGAGGFTTLNNNNLLIGTVNMTAGSTITFNNNGTWNVQGANVFNAAAGATLNNNRFINIAGTSTFTFGPAADALNNNNTITVIANNANATFTALENFNNNAIINMRNGVSAIAANGVTAAPYGTGIGNFVSTSGNFNAGGASIIRIDSFVGAPGAASSSDMLVVTMGATTGVTGLVINDLNAAGAFNPVGIPVVEVSSGVTALGHFVIAPGSSNFAIRNGVAVMDKGLFVTSIQLGASSAGIAGGVAHILVSTPDREIYELAKIGTAAQNIWHESAGVWNDRVTDLRNYLSVSAGQPNGAGADLPTDQGEPVAPVRSTRVTPGIWMKAFGSRTDRSKTDTFVLPAPAIGTFTFNTSYDQKTYGIIAGVDYGRSGPSDALLVGVFGGYLKSRVEFDVGPNAITYDGGTFGAYLSYLNRNFYFDLLAKADLLDVSYRAITLPGGAFSTTANTYGVRADMGYRYALNGSNRTFIEPLASFTWLTSDIGGMNILGTPVTFKDGNSVRGSLGLRLSSGQVRGAVRYNANLAVRVWHEFDNKANGLNFVSGGINQSINDSFTGTFGEVTGGLSAQNLRNGWSSFARGSFKFNEDIKTFTGRVGFRKQW